MCNSKQQQVYPGLPINAVYIPKNVSEFLYTDTIAVRDVLSCIPKHSNPTGALLELLQNACQHDKAKVVRFFAYTDNHMLGFLSLDNTVRMTGDMMRRLATLGDHESQQAGGADHDQAGAADLIAWAGNGAKCIWRTCPSLLWISVDSVKHIITFLRIKVAKSHSWLQLTTFTWNVLEDKTMLFVQKLGRDVTMDKFHNQVHGLNVFLQDECGAADAIAWDEGAGVASEFSRPPFTAKSADRAVLRD